MQITEPKWYRPVYYASRKLSKPERHYSMMEREVLGMVYSVTKYQHYLLGRKFSFHADHFALVYLVSKDPVTTGVWIRYISPARSSPCGSRLSKPVGIQRSRQWCSWQAEITCGSKPEFLFGVGHTISQGSRQKLTDYGPKWREKAVLREVHCGVTRGHYVGDATTRKIWRSRYWWSTTLKDAVR